MKVSDKLVYFAYPKCASEWARKQLNLTWNNKYIARNWERCDIDYCHVKPLIFIKHHHIDLESVQLVTIVRNTYERLVSCWAFGRKLKFIHDSSFSNFINRIYAHRASLHRMQLYWMFMPVAQYFEGVLDKVRFFQMHDLCAFIDFMKKEHGVIIEDTTKTNTTDHEHYSTYYTPELKKKVDEMYAYEIERFGYVCTPK